jgi:MFS family permease
MVILASLKQQAVGDVVGGVVIDRDLQSPRQGKMEKSFDDRAESVPAFRRRVRKTGDYSLGDFTAWATAGIAGLASLVLSLFVISQVLSGHNSPTYSSERSLWSAYIPEPVGILAIFCIPLSLALAASAFVERVMLGRRLGRSFHRKDAVLLLNDARYRRVRAFRNVISLLLAFIVFFPVSSEFQSPNLAWISLLGVLGVNAANAVVSQAKFGDAAYAAGFVVLASCPFIPIYSDSITSLGFLQIMAALLAGGAWLYRADRIWLVLAAGMGIIPVLISLGTSGYAFVAALIGGIASFYSILSVIAGCGNRLDEPREYRLALLSRLIWNRSNGNIALAKKVDGLVEKE